MVLGDSTTVVYFMVSLELVGALFWFVTALYLLNLSLRKARAYHSYTVLKVAGV